MVLGQFMGRFQLYVEAAALRDVDLPAFVAFQFEDGPVVGPDTEGVSSVSGRSRPHVREPMQRKP